jgi:archaemetzincin
VSRSWRIPLFAITKVYGKNHFGNWSNGHDLECSSVTWMIAAVAVLLSSVAMAFMPPDEKTMRDATGDLSGLPVVLQRAFAPDRDSFDSIPTPGLDDWLAGHQEPGQTFDEFKASQPNRPIQSRRIIYLQPLGEFPSDRSPSIDKLQKFAAAFFTMEVKALPPIRIDNAKFATRRNPNTGNPQIFTGDVLNFLKARVPADAFCILAITMEDLYPEPSWNFVFGQASLRRSRWRLQLCPVRSGILW